MTIHPQKIPSTKEGCFLTHLIFMLHHVAFGITWYSIKFICTKPIPLKPLTFKAYPLLGKRVTMGCNLCWRVCVILINFVISYKRGVGKLNGFCFSVYIKRYVNYSTSVIRKGSFYCRRSALLEGIWELTTRNCLSFFRWPGKNY